MFKNIFGVFLILHGLVHLLYFGQSARFFELQPGLVWPDGAWLLSKFLGRETTRMVANVMLILAAMAFTAAGIGLLTNQRWWGSMALGAAAFSTIIYLLMWDGSLQNLSEKGGVGILINFAILALILIFRWPV